MLFRRRKQRRLKALQIDDTCADAHLSLAVVRLFYDWDWSGADTEIQRGLNLAPNHAGAHFVYGKWLWAMGAHRRSDCGTRSEPLTWTLFPARSVSPWRALTTPRDNTTARLNSCSKTIELDPSFIVAQRLLSVALAYNGLYEDAVKQAQKTFSARTFTAR